jgi:hypothetical protein
MQRTETEANTLVLAVGSLAFGISKLLEPSKRPSEKDHPETRTGTSHRSPPNDSPLEDIEGKLRKLASLRSQNLISEEEYQRKRQEILARW